MGISRGTLGIGYVGHPRAKGVVAQRGTVGVGRAYFPAPVVPAYPLADLFDYYWSAQTLASITDGDPVPDWTDINAGKVLAQSVPTSRPAFRANRLGYPAIQGDGVADHLWSSDADLLINGAVSTPAALFMVLSGGTVTPNGEAGGWGYTFNNARHQIMRIIGSQVVAITGTTVTGPTGFYGAASQYQDAAINACLITTSGTELKVVADNGTVTTFAISGNWDTNRFALCGRLRSSFVVPSQHYIHACGIAKGALAAALHANPAALFAAASTEWGTP